MMAFLVHEKHDVPMSEFLLVEWPDRVDGEYRE